MGRTSDPDPSDYLVFVVRGWTKESLAKELRKELRGIPPDDIVSITYHADPFIWLFWSRNSALVVIRPEVNTDAAQ